jgi:hypothetical protein
MTRAIAQRTSVVAVAACATMAGGCSLPSDICEPQRASFAFFSKGDCILTRASFFQGHEWLTVLGNEDLPSQDRFPSDEIADIAEGNRRVDWPKELLVHLNVSIPSYVDALIDYTDRPEVQRYHFLLTDRNDSREAASDSHGVIREVSREAARLAVEDPTRSLTLMGQACHVLQDSFSDAHTFRDVDHAALPWCIVRVKAFAPRAEGFETYADGEPILFHGGSVDEDGHRLTTDSIGHTTTEDSIFRPGRDCHEPTTQAAVEQCLSEKALRARLATQAYLGAMQDVLRSGLANDALDAFVDLTMTSFIDQHLSLCPDAP